MSERAVAVITGASRGIGLACARALARAGHPVALAARTIEACVKEAGALADEGAKAEAFGLDLTKPQSFPAFLSEVQARLGPVGVLVNNAGIAFAAPLGRTPEADLRQVLEVNLVGAMLLTQAFLPGMLERRDGRIVNVASTAGRTGYRYTTAYCAAKHGLVGFTRALAVEVAARGVTVNAVCPGWTETEMLENSAKKIAETTGRSEEEARASLAAMNPMKRLVRPEEVAAVVAFLAGSAAGPVTGQCWGIDGGEVIA